MEFKKLLMGLSMAALLCGITACDKGAALQLAEDSNAIAKDAVAQQNNGNTEVNEDSSASDIVSSDKKAVDDTSKDPGDDGKVPTPKVDLVEISHLKQSNEDYASFLGVDAVTLSDSYKTIVSVSPEQITASQESLKKFIEYIFTNDGKIQDLLVDVKNELALAIEAADYYIDPNLFATHLNNITALFSKDINPRIRIAAEKYQLKLSFLANTDMDAEYSKAMGEALAPVLKKFSIDASSGHPVIHSLEALLESVTVVYTQPDGNIAKAGVANFVNGSEIYYFGNGHGGFGAVSVDQLGVFPKYTYVAKTENEMAQQATPSKSDFPYVKASTKNTLINHLDLMADPEGK